MCCAMNIYVYEFSLESNSLYLHLEVAVSKRTKIPKN